MRRSEAEDELRVRFGQTYQRNQRPVMKHIERTVCGCDYGATSWATREEVETISTKLALRPGAYLMDLGAGSGWPGLYLASLPGCNVVLVDLPEEGLAIAAVRARADRLPGIYGAVADGRALPWADRHFDAITHSDVLCCLPDKQSVLAECRRTIRADGRMIFSVISITPDLDDGDHTVPSSSDHPTLSLQPTMTSSFDNGLDHGRANRLHRPVFGRRQFVLRTRPSQQDGTYRLVRRG